MPLKSEVAALFDRWNASLRTGDPRRVVANYAPNSILLPTVSNRVRFTIAEKEDYFTHFLMRRPEGSIDDRLIEVDCNSATDSGLYTFRFADGTMVKARYSFAYTPFIGIAGETCPRSGGRHRAWRRERRRQARAWLGALPLREAPQERASAVSRPGMAGRPVPAGC